MLTLDGVAHFTFVVSCRPTLCRVEPMAKQLESFASLTTVFGNWNPTPSKFSTFQRTIY